MTFTEQQLKEVEEFAGLFFTRTQILRIFELKDHVLGENDFTVRFEDAFEKGRLKSEAEIRKSIFEHALNGSSPAQQMVMKIMEDVKLTEKF